MKTPTVFYDLRNEESDPAHVLHSTSQQHAVTRRHPHNRISEVDYFTAILKEHLQEYFPNEMMLLKDMRSRARIAYKESIRTDIPVSHAFSNALRYLLFGYELTGFERLKSEIWMQGYYMQEKGRHIELPEVALNIFAGELSLRCRSFLEKYQYVRDREAFFIRCGIREIVTTFLINRWEL